VAYSNSTTRRKNPRGSPSNENEDGCEGRYGFQSESDNRPASDGEIYPTGPTIGFWRDADWLFCRDGKWRPVEPGTFPLVDGTPARVGRLRGFGNAINAEAAVAFIESAIDSLDNSRIY
jgi:DNA (cytosine-5)-methyltransferase 1